MPIVTAKTKNLKANENIQPNVGVYSYAGKGEGSHAMCAQYEFNVALLRDPAGQKQFSGLDGQHVDVQEWIKRDVRIDLIVQTCLLIADDAVKPKLIQRANATVLERNNMWVSFSFYDPHGKWISPAIAELVAKALDKDGHTVLVKHHVLEDVEDADRAG